MKQSEGVFQSGVPSRRRAVVSMGMAFGFWLLVIVPAFAGNFYAGTLPANVPWPGGIVPYEFTNSLTTTQQVTYLDGLREWELAAKVKFVPHTNQTHWILFAYNTNGFDKVSSSTNPQVVSVASLSRAQVCHEMGHSFGFTHENIRPDATNFIAVLTNNIANEASNIYWFTVDPTSTTNGNYDFESVMHLGWDFDSINPGVLPTQQPRPAYFPRYQFRMGNFCLSPGDRAALAYLYGPPAVPLTNVVTTTADVGPGSLRAAIYYATDHPGTTIRFAIPAGDPGYSNGVFNLHLTGMLPPLVTDGTVIDGSTQPGFAGRPLIFVDASQVLPETFTSDTFLIYSANNQIKNISFSGFDWNGLTLIYPGATNNTVSGCWFGLDATGTNAAPNAFQGILIAAGASRNIVGGTNALARNVISGNSQYGVFITDSNTTGNIVLGNYIGTDVGGSMAVPNFFSGVFIGNSASGNIVGSTNPAVPNVLSGNTQYGVILTSNTTGNVVLGNYIGTGAGGSFMVSNVMGGVLLADGATRNLIGGTNAGTGNVISGNSGNGILLRGSDVVSNAVQGNFIGTDATGMNPLPNTVAGVTIDTGATFNLIGGAVAGARNVISGNNLSYDSGVFVADPGTSGNVVEGNYIGLGPDGMTAVPNYYGIICSDGATGNTFGGTVVGARNVISGNSGYGVSVRYPGTSDNVVEGNYIGLDANGVAAVPDDFGVICYGGATNNLIGGTSVGAANFVSGNYYGVCLADPGTSGNFVEGNYIGTDWTGTNGVGNFDNVALQNNATGNFIGGVNAGAGNVIAFATGNGVVLYQSGTTNNSIRGNSIFSNNYLGIDLNGDGVTTNHSGFLAGPNDFQNYPAITNALVAGANTVISGNLNSTPNASFFVDVYRNISPNPSGYGEGQFYVGTVNLTTDVSGNGAFTLTAAGNYAGQNFSATATAADGDTSEFCADQPAVFGPAARFVGPYQSRTNGFTFSLTLQTNFSYRIQAATNLAPPVVWTDLTNFAATDSLFSFTDHFTTNYRVRFYRVVSP
ncbi:MAG TPA: M12 family metallopeptidase [Candidatus Acidoferrales bacterium]|nr:M12 family metallopeptidase [Candidatus Acidoferrales bacterium]